jgi:hypothetical protein
MKIWLPAMSWAASASSVRLSSGAQDFNTFGSEIGKCVEQLRRGTAQRSLPADYPKEALCCRGQCIQDRV